MKRILILGKDSYLGENFKKWINKWPEAYQVDIVGTIDSEWRNEDVSRYDVVVNFAGIAHINNRTLEMEPLFYSINRNLAIEMCEWAKKSGVKQFVHISSMNVYGDFCDDVNDRDAVNPTSFYGKSKYEGDIGVQKLADDDFKVACVRPPFVYGKGCKGNYNTVRKLALSLPIFATYKNRKSMIYIDNLCEFLRLLIDEGSGGIYTPQNRELVSTADLIKEIAYFHKHKIWFTCLFNWMIPLGIKMSKTIKKAFHNDSYVLELSRYYDWKYCVVDFSESIKRTEE